MTIEMQALKKLVIESEKERDRESVTMRYPRIVFNKPRDGKEEAEKSEEGETLEATEADEPEAAKANVSDSR